MSDKKKRVEFREPEKMCDCCDKPCEPREVTIDDSFRYEYGSEVGVHSLISTELLSDCCEAEMRDPEGSECWEPETLRSETFKFLNELRESGKTNMFDAVPHIMEEMAISSPDARVLLLDWMENFGRP